MKSVWDSIEDSPASAAAASSSSASSSPAPVVPAAAVAVGTAGAAFDPNDGRVRYSCLLPALAGGAMGGVCGAVMSKAQGRPLAMPMAFQGCVALGANALGNCAMHKATDTSIFEPSQFRAVTFAVTGAVYPLAGEFYARVLQPKASASLLPPVPRAVLVRQTLLFAAFGALGGFLLDSFNLGRPVRPGSEPTAATSSSSAPIFVDKRPDRHVPVAGTKRAES